MDSVANKYFCAPGNKILIPHLIAQNKISTMECYQCSHLSECVVQWKTSSAASSKRHVNLIKW